MEGMTALVPNPIRPAKPTFVEVDAPGNDEAHALLRTLIVRLIKMLVRRAEDRSPGRRDGCSANRRALRGYCGRASGPACARVSDSTGRIGLRSPVRAGCPALSPARSTTS
jgi:hypothetical protein